MYFQLFKWTGILTMLSTFMLFCMMASYCIASMVLGYEAKASRGTVFFWVKTTVIGFVLTCVFGFMV